MYARRQGKIASKRRCSFERCSTSKTRVSMSRFRFPVRPDGICGQQLVVHDYFSKRRKKGKTFETFKRVYCSQIDIFIASRQLHTHDICGFFFSQYTAVVSFFRCRDSRTRGHGRARVVCFLLCVKVGNRGHVFVFDGSLRERLALFLL